jgi:ubiquinone/menaquinone biosynthesis C-methylase UbiE
MAEIKQNKKKSEIIKRKRTERYLSGMMAKYYDKMIKGYENIFKCVIELTGKYLYKNSQVLEIGAGTGIISLGITEKAERIKGIDISPEMIKIAREKLKKLQLKNVNFEIGDGYETGYKSESFDLIIIANILHLVKEPDTLLIESYRLLKKGGYLITLTDCYNEKSNISFKIQIFIYGIMKLLGLIYLNKYKNEDIKELLGNNNFKIMESVKVNKIPACYFISGMK